MTETLKKVSSSSLSYILVVPAPIARSKGEGGR